MKLITKVKYMSVLMVLLMAAVPSAQMMADDIVINATNFPDENFRNYLLRIGMGRDGILTEEELSEIVDLNLNQKGIQDLTGIEYFTNLKILQCASNELAVLDISKNRALIGLNCAGNKLTALDVSNNPSLQALSCEINQITSLDVSNNDALTMLACYLNRLTSLDVSMCTELTSLDCRLNLLITIDVSHCLKLEELLCAGNLLTSIKLSEENVALNNFWCYMNKLDEQAIQEIVGQLPISDNGYLVITANAVMDAEQIEAMIAAYGYAYHFEEENKYTPIQIDIAKHKGWWTLASGNEGFVEIEGEEPVTYIDINEANFPDEHFRNYLTNELRTKNMTLFTFGQDGRLSEKERSCVTDLNLSMKEISDLKGIEYFFNLKTLNCDNNKLTSLDLSQCPKLSELSCYNNKLTSLDVSNCSGLTKIFCANNQIRGSGMEAFINSLPIVNSSESDGTKGELYLISDNNLEGNEITPQQVGRANSKGWIVYRGISNGTWEEMEGETPEPATIAIDATNFPDNIFRAYLRAQDYGRDEVLTEEEIESVTEMRINYSPVKNLVGIEHFKNLRILECNYIGLQSIDVSKNTLLEELYCQQNELTSLNVSGCVHLKKLQCSQCQLSSIDVSNTPNLEELNCSYNLLTSIDVSKNLNLKYLLCTSNKLTSIDVSKNQKLTYLCCEDNQLTSIDVSKNVELSTLYCSQNELKTLDVSRNINLAALDCISTMLTALDLSKNAKLEWLFCCRNQFSWEAMTSLIASLPEVESGRLIALAPEKADVFTSLHVEMAKAKGWTSYGYKTYMSFEDLYELEGISMIALDDEQAVTFSGIDGLNADTNLYGNVINNIFYYIDQANGGYDAENGCITLTKPISTALVSSFTNESFLGEHFLNEFSGLVLMAPSGNNTLKITAETTGNSLLGVKIASGEVTQRATDGRQGLLYSYNLTENPLVYIFTSQNGAGVKAQTGAVADGPDVLKIYGIELVTGEDGIEAIGNRHLTIDNVIIYNLSGQRLSKPQRGVNIIDGKKVIVR